MNKAISVLMTHCAGNVPNRDTFVTSPVSGGVQYMHLAGNRICLVRRGTGHV